MIRLIAFIRSRLREMMGGREEFQLPVCEVGRAVLDIWLLIFGYFTDPADFQNILLVSPEYFDTLMGSREKTALFPLALNVLDRRDYIAKSTTLKCRFLSKFNKSSIDKLIRVGNPCLENLDGCDHDKWDPKHDALHCWRPSVFSRWRSHVRNVNTKFNPFLDGYVALFVDRNTNQQDQGLRNFRIALVHFGNQICYFSFGARGGTIQLLELLGEFLERMSNLRTLAIGDYTQRDSKSQRFLPSILPNLRDLSTLKIDPGSSIHLVSAVLERYGNQLKKICFRNLPQGKFTHLPLGFARNLKQVSLPEIRSTDHVLEYLNPTRKRWLPTLETLSVTVYAGSLELITELLAALEKSFRRRSSKLQNLNIFLTDPINRSSYIESTVRLFLPSLKRLWIHCEGCDLQSIDFILGMRKTLKEFTLDMRLHHTDEVSRRLQEDANFAELLDSMDDRELWKKMVKLEGITIRRRRARNGAAEVHTFGRPKHSQQLSRRSNCSI